MRKLLNKVNQDEIQLVRKQKQKTPKQKKVFRAKSLKICVKKWSHSNNIKLRKRNALLHCWLNAICKSKRCSSNWRNCEAELKMMKNRRSHKNEKRTKNKFKINLHF